MLPFFHIYGMNSLLNASLLHRMRLVTMSAFDLVKFLEAIERYRVDLTCIAPPTAVALAKHLVVAEYDLTSMTHMVSGAAALAGDLAGSVSGRIGSTVVQGYGMTETSPVTHCAVFGEAPGASIGHPVSNTEAEVTGVVGVLRESDGEEVPRAFTVPQVREGSPVKVDAGELMG